MEDSKKSQDIYKFRIFAIKPDGSLGIFLGYVYAYTIIEAQMEAKALFGKKHFKYGVEVVRADVN